MLDIQTFDARRGGNVLYKALVHPLAAEAIAALAAELQAAGPLAVFDPDGVAGALFALHPHMPKPAELYVQDVAALGVRTAGVEARPLVDLPRSSCRVVLIASFESARIEQRIAPFCPPGATIISLDKARLPSEMLTNSRVARSAVQGASRLFFHFRHQFRRCVCLPLRDLGQRHQRVAHRPQAGD